MAKDSVYSILQHPVTEHGRNVFPLDNRHIYSMKAGQITPIKALHYKPGDYFDIQAHDFSMTFPMNTAAFLRGRKEFSFYSVYYNAIWSLFNQYQASRENPKTSAFNGNGKLVEPRMPLFDLLINVWGQWIKYIYYEYYLSYYADVVPMSPSLDLIRQSWLDSLDVYTIFSLEQNVTIDNVSATFVSNHFSATAWSSIQLRENFIYNTANMKMRSYVLDIVGHFRAYSWLRKLDMLGYGNYYPLFSSAESVIAQLTAPTDSASLAVWLEDACDQMLALLGYLAETCWKYTGISLYSLSSIDDEKHYNLYPICAYNSIFYHFFRNSYYDNDYYTHDYSLDFVSVANNFGSYNIVHPNNFSARFLDIEYHQWKKDRFTAVLPDQQFGSVSGLTLSTHPDVTGSDYGKWSVSNGSSLSDSISSPNVGTFSNGNLTEATIGSSIVHYHNIPVNQVGFDVIALKRAEMLQEYRQLLMRAGNKTTDIFRAIYGESCSSEHVDDIIPRFMDTFGEDIFVDPVQATAQTGSGANQTLGDLSARGKFSGSSGRVKFNAGGNFGVILCLAYVIPTSEYNSYIVDRHLMELSPNAHFIPQFENLGLDDIYNFELNCLLPYNEMQSIGKAPRYFHKKTEVDMVHGAFCSLSKNIMYGSSYASFLLNSLYGGWFGTFNHWVSPRTELQGRVSTALRDFYVNPSVLDNVFVQAAGADQSQDQFICNTYFEIRSTKEMTKIGLPNFV